MLAPTYEMLPARVGLDDGERYDPPSVGIGAPPKFCLLYTSDAADERSSVDLGGRRIIKKKNNASCGRYSASPDQPYNNRETRNAEHKECTTNQIEMKMN